MTVRALAERITAQGWRVSHTQVSRFEYAVERLLPVIPAALWSEDVHQLVRDIRRLERSYANQWSYTDAGRSDPQRIIDVFFDTLRAFDDESIVIRDFINAMDKALSKESGMTKSQLIGIHLQKLDEEENELLSPPASRPVLSVVIQSHKPGDPGSGGE